MHAAGRGFDCHRNVFVVYSRMRPGHTANFLAFTRGRSIDIYTTQRPRYTQKSWSTRNVDFASVGRLGM
jgi:hypothetical protein